LACTAIIMLKYTPHIYKIGIFFFADMETWAIILIIFLIIFGQIRILETSYYKTIDLSQLGFGKISKEITAQEYKQL